MRYELHINHHIKNFTPKPINSNSLRVLCTEKARKGHFYDGKEGPKLTRDYYNTFEEAKGSCPGLKIIYWKLFRHL